MKRQKKRFSRPSQRWDKKRIREESQLLSDYGLKNKKELWKAKGMVKTFRSRARRLFTEETGREELFGRLRKLGIFRGEADLDDVLGLEVRDVLERRLQTLVLRKGLASTPKQARQLIVHRHIRVGGSIVDAPGYMVTVDEEKAIEYAPNSPLSDEDHPLRSAPSAEEGKPAEKEEKAGKGEKAGKKAKGEEKPEKKGETGKETPKEKEEKQAKEKPKKEGGKEPKAKEEGEGKEKGD